MVWIDELGGLLNGELHLFYGPFGSGKTLLLGELAVLTEGDVIWVDTESFSKHPRYLLKVFETWAKIHEKQTNHIHIYVMRTYSELHSFFGGRDEKQDVTTLKNAIGNKLKPKLLVIDSITRFYNKEINNAPPSDRPHVASRFGARLLLWMEYIAKLMENLDPFPIVATAWPSSTRLAEMLSKKTPSQIDQHALEREFTGGKTLGHLAKLTYRVVRQGTTITVTVTRGPYMGKTTTIQLPKVV